MSARFTDFQDDTNPLNGAKVDDADALSRVLEAHRGRDPFLCEFENDRGDCLLVGLGGAIGCAQYTAAGDPAPAQMARSSPTSDDGEALEFGEDVEFLCGDTPTPIPACWQLAPSTVEKIARYFIETGERWPEIAWEVV